MKKRIGAAKTPLGLTSLTGLLWRATCGALARARLHKALTVLATAIRGRMLWGHLRWVSRCGSLHGHRTRRHVWLLSISLWTVRLLTIRLRRWHLLTILPILRSVCLLLHVLLLRSLHVLGASRRRKAD